jgi:hypothetical protein
MTPPRLILEVNTRLWLRRLGGGSPVSLRVVPDEVLNQWARAGFDAVWLMGIWRPSTASRDIALEHPGLRADFSRILPEWTPEDVVGSPYAVAGYDVPAEWGGEEALADLRSRMKRKGLRLILDFVPNHTSRDHPWVFDHPEWYMQLAEEFLARNPEHGFRAATASGQAIIAHGKDPYFPSWTDTAQLNYRHSQLHQAQRELLHRLAGWCDGVRCDMAMLILPEVFEKVWQGNDALPEFWEPTIREIKAAHPEFCFIAETYWGLDRALNERGFDLTYDKELLDHVATDVPLAKEQFDLPIEQHRRRVRFLENHDEPRVASRLPRGKHFAAATWLAMLPSSLLIYDGQMEGFKNKSPIQLRRDPVEVADTEVQEFYRELLDVARRYAVRRGEWRMLGCRPAWIGNDTHRFILAQAYDLENEHLRVYVNWSNQRSQCWSDVHLSGLLDREVVLRDQLGPKKFVRQGTELMMRGLYLDLDPWEVQVFACEAREVR